MRNRDYEMLAECYQTTTYRGLVLNLVEEGKTKQEIKRILLEADAAAAAAPRANAQAAVAGTDLAGSAPYAAAPTGR